MRMPVFVAPIANLPSARVDLPCRQVQCHCPQACWVAESTLAACAKAGKKPTYYCPTCCPDEVRDQVHALSDEAKLLMAAGQLPYDQPVGALIIGGRKYMEEED